MILSEKDSFSFEDFPTPFILFIYFFFCVCAEQLGRNESLLDLPSCGKGVWKQFLAASLDSFSSL